MEKIKALLPGRSRHYEQLRDMTGTADENGELPLADANVYLDIEESHLPTPSERAHRYIGHLVRLRAPPTPRILHGASRDFYHSLARVVMGRVYLDSACYFEMARSVLEYVERGEIVSLPPQPRPSVIVASGVDDGTYRVELMAVFEVLFMVTTIIGFEVHAEHELAVRAWDDMSSFLRRFREPLTQLLVNDGLKVMGFAPVEKPKEGVFNPAKWLIITRLASPLAEYVRNVVRAALDPSLVPDEDLRISVTGDNLGNLVVQVMAHLAGNKTLAEESKSDKTDWHVFTLWPFLCWQYAQAQLKPTAPATATHSSVSSSSLL
jgi:hypothetical protein